MSSRSELIFKWYFTLPNTLELGVLILKGIKCVAAVHTNSLVGAYRNSFLVFVCDCSRSGLAENLVQIRFVRILVLQIIIDIFCLFFLLSKFLHTSTSESRKMRPAHTTKRLLVVEREGDTGWSIYFT